MNEELNQQAIQSLVMEMKSLKCDKPTWPDVKRGLVSGKNAPANLKSQLEAQIRKNNELLDHIKFLQSLPAEKGTLSKLRRLIDDALSCFVNGTGTAKPLSLIRRQTVWEYYKLEFATGREACQCCHCGKLLAWEDFTVEHLKPKNIGGGDEIENLRPSCEPCNSGRPHNEIAVLPFEK